MGQDMKYSRVQSEQLFHDTLVASHFRSREWIRRAASAFYDGHVVDELLGQQRHNLISKKALDYGCGRGELSRRLASWGASVYGIDISPALVTLARDKRQQEVSDSRNPFFVIGDAHQLPFPNDSFDYVFGSGILHHLNIPQAYREIHRVLKPGGEAWFVEPLSKHPILRVIRRLTPNARSSMEAPLTFDDIRLATQWFAEVEHTEEFLVSVALGVLGFISAGTQRIFLRPFKRFDRFLFRHIPWTRQFAWITIIHLRKPANGAISSCLRHHAGAQ